MSEPRQATRAELLRLSVEAECDERTIRRVLADPSHADKSRAATRALKALREAGLLPSAVA